MLGLMARHCPMLAAHNNEVPWVSALHYMTDARNADATHSRECSSPPAQPR